MAVQRINTGQQDVSPCAENGRPPLWEHDGVDGAIDLFIHSAWYHKNVVGTFFKRKKKIRPFDSPTFGL